MRCEKRIKLIQYRIFTIYFFGTALICGENLIKAIPPVRNMILNLKRYAPKHLQ